MECAALVHHQASINICTTNSPTCHTILFFLLTAPFIVMSYNILCDKYATRAMYGYCPSWALGWDYRRQAILKELIDSMADIISLQVIAHHIIGV